MLFLRKHFDDRGLHIVDADAGHTGMTVHGTDLETTALARNIMLEKRETGRCRKPLARRVTLTVDRHDRRADGRGKMGRARIEAEVEIADTEKSGGLPNVEFPRGIANVRDL